jgi:hypothetical protein
MDDAAVHSTNEIEYAKRKRGKARQYRDSDQDHFDVLDSHDDKDVVDESLSLITDQNADPDHYESNAGGNASCPVEPFNMDAEKESGLGYFDGDTYIFRKKVVEGEEDAWLDGGVGDDEEEEGGVVGPGGLDSTSIWKPREDGEGKKQTKNLKYVSEDDTLEDIGRRLVSLLTPLVPDDDKPHMVEAMLARHLMRSFSSVSVVGKPEPSRPWILRSPEAGKSPYVVPKACSMLIVSLMTSAQMGGVIGMIWATGKMPLLATAEVMGFWAVRTSGLTLVSPKMDATGSPMASTILCVWGPVRDAKSRANPLPSGSCMPPGRRISNWCARLTVDAPWVYVR